jgi:diguanylate cyclase (GGDEF)-like protein
MVRKYYSIVVQHFFLIAVWGVIIYGLHTRMTERQTIYMDNALHEVELEFRAVKESYDMLSQHVYVNDIAREPVTALMAEALQAVDASKREQLRSRLFELLTPLYSALQQQHIRQLHFHLPGAVSFARFHRREKYGDALWDVRYSIRKVNETRGYVAGFEEGRVFNGFRHVFPLFHRGSFVGSVEISYSFDAIEEAALKIFPAVYSLILHEAPIRTKVWPREMDNYALCDLSDRYFYDVAARQLLKNRTDSVIDYKTIVRINRAIRARIADRLDRGDPFNISLVLDGKGYIINFIPVRNVEGHHVAYLISYAADDTPARLHNDFITETLITTFLFGLIAVVQFLYRQNRHHIREKLLFKQRAHTDTLTGIQNRQGFLSAVDDYIRDALQTQQPFGVIFFDIDYFKEINDRYGHAAGDKALVELSRLIQKSLRKSDCFARWGGEEFVVLLPQTSSKEASRLAEKLREQIARHRFSHGSMQCSFGVTQFHPGEGKEALMQRVDRALYRAKEEGRNRVRSVP